VHYLVLWLLIAGITDDDYQRLIKYKSKERPGAGKSVCIQKKKLSQ